MLWLLVYFSSLFGILIFLHISQKTACLNAFPAYLSETLWFVKPEESFIKVTSSVSYKLAHQQDFWLPATGKKKTPLWKYNMSTAVSQALLLIKNQKAIYINIWTQWVFHDKPSALFAKVRCCPLQRCCLTVALCMIFICFFILSGEQSLLIYCVASPL